MTGRGLALVLALATGPAQAGTPESQVLSLINQARAEAGCPALVPDPALTRAARVQSQGMALDDYFGHRDPQGHGFAWRARAQGYAYRWIGENIAAGQPSAAAVVQDWLQSPAHRRNILDCRYVETGIAMTHQADDRPLPRLGQPLHYYWVQVFGAGS